MPIINVQLIEDVFTPDQSARSSSASPTRWSRSKARTYPRCVVEEVASGDMGVGGKPLSTEDVKALAAGVPA